MKILPLNIETDRTIFESNTDRFDGETPCRNVFLTIPTRSYFNVGPIEAREMLSTYYWRTRGKGVQLPNWYRMPGFRRDGYTRRSRATCEDQACGIDMASNMARIAAPALQVSGKKTDGFPIVSRKYNRPQLHRTLGLGFGKSAVLGRVRVLVLWWSRRALTP